MFQTLKWLAAMAVLILLVVFGGGYAISPTFTVKRSITMNATPDKVFELIADPRAWKKWAVWNQRDPSMAITYSGPPAGKGAVWEWKSKSEGDGRMSFTAAEPGKRLAYELYLPDFGTTSQGDLVLSTDGGGTRVTWTMNGDMGKSPVARWMTLFMDSMVGKDFDAGLAKLKSVAEKT